MRRFFYKMRTHLGESLLGSAIVSLSLSLFLVLCYFVEIRIAIKSGFSAALLIFAASTSGLVLALLAQPIRRAFLLALELVRRPRQIVKKVPGLSLMTLVNFLYSQDDVEKTFKPIVSDWHKEYLEALAAQRLWKSRWINFRYRYRFAQAIGLSKAWRLIDSAVRIMTSGISK